jgi:monovalent cation:H+ antiporter-2, CPA2 family
MSPRLSACPAPSAAAPEAEQRYREVIVGHGHVGRTVARLLREQEIEPSVIEMNLTTVQQLREVGVNAFYGAATLQTTLEQADVGSAGTFVLSVSGLRGAEEVIRLARELNPGIHIIARTRHLSAIPALRRAGADRVFSGEGEVALAMTEAILSDLGATPDPIDRERAGA